MSKDTRPRCAAVLKVQYRGQQPWVKLCEQRASHEVKGVPLCGTHYNSAFDSPTKVIMELQRLTWDVALMDSVMQYSKDTGDF